MTDKFKRIDKKAPSEIVGAWKAVTVEKEHQPPTEKSYMTYEELELKKAKLVAEKAGLDVKIDECESLMDKVKEAVDAE